MILQRSHFKVEGETSLRGVRWLSPYTPTKFWPGKKSRKHNNTREKQHLASDIRVHTIWLFDFACLECL